MDENEIIGVVRKATNLKGHLRYDARPMLNKRHGGVHWCTLAINALAPTEREREAPRQRWL